MGNLLRLLSRDGDSCCVTRKQDIFVDFENAFPSCPREETIYYEAETVLNESIVVLRDLEDYKGASLKIRDAIRKPTDENENEAWNALIPLVQKSKTFYVFSKKMEFIVPKLLNELISINSNEYYDSSNGGGHEGAQSTDNKIIFPTSIVEILDERQALVKQFAKILEFVLKFDEKKMMNPTLQNDFSYYRRTTQRSTFNRNLIVTVDLATSMSMFFGRATPMLHALSTSVESFIKNCEDDAKKRRAVDTLGVMANVCQKMLGTPNLRARIQHQEETELFILRVMTAIIILYDHVDQDGVFHKNSHVDVKGCLKILRDQQKTRVESLFNALRYTTKHLNDNSTPKSTKSLVFDELS